MTIEAPTYHGHRQRLKDRFKTAGADGFPDYEFLEMMLFSVIPRRDTKPLAKRLIATFGDFADVVTAPPESLAAVPGVGPAVVKHFELIQMVQARVASRTNTQARPRLDTWSALLQYCRALPTVSGDPALRLVLLDGHNRVMGDEQSTMEGLVPADVVKRALATSASAVILVRHEETATPSLRDEDIAFARDANAIAKPLNIDLHDYLLLGTEDHISLRGGGLF